METMYSGYAALANGEQISAATDAGRWLAVDVAHLGIQMYHGILAKSVLHRLMSYERIAEVHVCTSHEHSDTQAKLAPFLGRRGCSCVPSGRGTGQPIADTGLVAYCCGGAASRMTAPRSSVRTSRAKRWTGCRSGALTEA